MFPGKSFGRWKLLVVLTASLFSQTARSTKTDTRIDSTVLFSEVIKTIRPADADELFDILLKMHFQRNQVILWKQKHRQLFVNFPIFENFRIFAQNPILCWKIAFSWKNIFLYAFYNKFTLFSRFLKKSCFPQKQARFLFEKPFRTYLKSYYSICIVLQIFYNVEMKSFQNQNL